VPARKAGNVWRITGDFDRVRMGLHLPMRPTRRVA
jgi:hypothetical protein